jgi:hypothetical protein
METNSSQSFFYVLTATRDPFLFAMTALLPRFFFHVQVRPA